MIRSPVSGKVIATPAPPATTHRPEHIRLEQRRRWTYLVCWCGGRQRVELYLGKRKRERHVVPTAEVSAWTEQHRACGGAP